MLGSNSEDIILYLFIYSISLLLVLYNKNPYFISLILFSISGMPPFAGFYTKLYILQDLLIINQYLLFLFILSSIILTANYLSIILTLLFKSSYYTYLHKPSPYAYSLSLVNTVILGWWLI